MGRTNKAATTAMKVGVLTPHAAAGAESELPLMAPAFVHTAVSRIQAFTPGAPNDQPPPGTPAELRALAAPAVVNHAAAAFRPGSVDALCYASTSTAYAIGHNAELALVRQLRHRWGIPVCSTATSAVRALRFLDIDRVNLIHPPWFGDLLNRLGSAYFKGEGFTVVDAQLAALPRDPALIEPAMVVDWVSRSVSDAAEAVVLGGTGFRAAEAIDELEGRLGRPVLEANQVLLWSLITGPASPPDLDGFGELFAH